MDGSLASLTNNPLQQAYNDIEKLQSEIDLTNCLESPFPTPENIKNILLTGATGFVGCHLLSNLLQTTHATIHCIVRARDDQEAQQRVIKKLEEQKCLAPNVSTRIVAYAGDLSVSNLGIASSSLSFLESIDSIYHVGAVVNWVLPYSQLRENVTGGVEIIKMMAERKKKVPFHLISTIGAFAVDVANKEQDSPAMTGLGGYPQSKWASEQITLHARSKGLPVTIFRSYYLYYYYL